MTYFHKDPTAHQPFGPQESHVLSNLGPQAQTVEMAGLFALEASRVIEPEAITTVGEYQQWSSQDWKKPHGTYKAAQRFSAKLIEETGELREAFRAYHSATADDKSTLAAEAISEMGDVIWCAAALAANSSADIDSGLKLRLYDHTMGTRVWSNGTSMTPPWHEQSRNLSTKPTEVTLDDLQQLINADFEPTPSPAINLDDDEPFLGLFEHVDALQYYAVTLRSLADQQYAYGEQESTIVMPELYDRIAKDIGIVAAIVFLEAAYIIHHAFGKDLQAVIAKNTAKITGRVQGGYVDKTDGERPTDLL